MSNPKVLVSVEKVVHDALRDAVQAVWNEHKICVQSADFTWVDVSTPGSPDLILTDVRLNTMTK